MLIIYVIYRITSGNINIATRLQAGGFGVRIQVLIQMFLFSKTPRPALGPNQPPI
jgi:hypothetical protein